MGSEMCSDSETGSYLRHIDSCITQLKVQGPSATWHESKEDEEEGSKNFVYAGTRGGPVGARDAPASP